jgi:hypothetical protein
MALKNGGFGSEAIYALQSRTNYPLQNTLNELNAIHWNKKLVLSEKLPVMENLLPN